MKKIILIILILVIMITIFTGYFFVVEKEKITEQQTLNNEINLIIEKNNQKTSSENFSYSIKNSNGYGYIEIEKFETLFKDNMPMIPYKKFEFDVPLDAEISVKAIFTNQATISNINVPAFISPPPMPEDNWDSRPVNVSDELGIFPKKQFSYRKIKLGGNAIVQVIVYPLTYDSSKDEIILSKNILLKISYNSTSNGVVKNFNVYNSKFESNSQIETFTTIKNVANSPKKFKIHVKIKDLSESVIETTEQIIELNGNEEKRIPIKIKTPLDSGAYYIVMNAYENDQEIGSAYKDINIIPRQNVIINNFNISKKVLKNGDSYAFFNIEIKNPTNESFRAYIDLYVQQGPVEINKRPQMFVDLGPKEVKEKSDSWNINNLDPGFYSVQAVVSVGEFWTDSMESLEVTQ